MRFFQNSTQLFSFDATVLCNFVNAQPNASAYRCNPNAPANRNCGEPYAFLNFYAHSGTSFDRIVFDQVTSGGYESDNYTVGRWLQPGGTWVPHGASVSGIAGGHHTQCNSGTSGLDDAAGRFWPSGRYFASPHECHFRLTVDFEPTVE